MQGTVHAQPPSITGMLGVLGGMGPLATAWFYQRVIEATPSARDQDHVPIVIWGDPTVPDRSAALLQRDAPNPTPWLLRGANVLAALGAELIAVPCNSAHPFLTELRLAVDVPLVDMVMATVDRVVERLGPGGRVAVLCTEGAYHAEIYQQCLRTAGLDPLDVSVTDRQLIHAAIGDIKAGRLDAARRTVQDVVGDLTATRPDVVISGCTELTAIRDDIEDACTVVDSATVLAATAVAALRDHGAN